MNRQPVISLFTVVVDVQRTFMFAVCWLGALNSSCLIQFAEMIEYGGKLRSSLI